MNGNGKIVKIIKIKCGVNTFNLLRNTCESQGTNPSHTYCNEQGTFCIEWDDITNKELLMICEILGLIDEILNVDTIPSEWYEYELSVSSYRTVNSNTPRLIVA